MEIEQEIIKQTSSFKLMKMSKGYNWEIKIYGDDLGGIKGDVETMDAWAKMKWGIPKEIINAEGN